MHALQIQVHPLGIHKTSEKIMLISPLKSARNLTESTRSLCRSAVVFGGGGGPFSKLNLHATCFVQSYIIHFLHRPCYHLYTPTYTHDDIHKLSTNTNLLYVTEINRQFQADVNKNKFYYTYFTCTILKIRITAINIKV